MAGEHARVRYLDAKRTVDERAFDRRVRERLRSALPPAPSVFDAGAGTGVTVPRLLDWGVDAGRYRGVERSAELVEHAREARAAELERAGYDPDPTESGFRVADLEVAFERGDALEAARTADADLVVAQAFVDLVSLPEAVDAFEAALAPGGLAYFPITFDGGTIFQPDHPDDDAVERAYHRSIDDRPGRDSRAGRHLLDLLRRADGDLLAVGASDWIVRPHDGSYPADEAYFLECILGFVADALADADVDAEGWVETRREQLAAGELSYVAHGYDLLYRAP
ncbi:class I SAM-dependent methyltransferase [Halorarum halophilum]|uniref:Class I SAM-dependent methyltransferase n=1 Tax=Halorarum halophilum TaxID=2743090 RepID=A0A7D5L2U0_9EURY|nr:class I SAM-dependent methyltransferase [Halobaculum halophilum]QLG28123.1 class I SAM-dependent methyltransferase [Halobaculum halophilum]